MTSESCDDPLAYLEQQVSECHVTKTRKSRSRSRSPTSLMSGTLNEWNEFQKREADVHPGLNRGEAAKRYQYEKHSKK